MTESNPDYSAIREAFFLDAPSRVGILEEGLAGLGPQAGDVMDALAFVAHALRGAAATAGQHVAADAAAVLETALRAGNRERARAAVSAIRAALEPQVVLHVEDDATNAALVERVVGKRPHLRLVTTTSGVAALDLIQREQPALVVLDLHLPDMLGEEVLQQIRANEATADVPVVVVSGEARSAEIERVSAAGVHRYLTKPVSIALLLDILDELVPAGGGAAAPVVHTGFEASTSSRNGEGEHLRRADEQRLRLALAAGGLDLWEWDVGSGRITWRGLADFGFPANPLGTTQQEVASRVHPEDLPGMFDAMERTLTDGSDFVAEFRFALPTGEVRWLSMRGAPESSGGQPERVVGVIQDVTERKLAELGMRRENNDLEERIQERTKQLEDSVAESVRANTAKSTFLMHLSHELRIPLNSLTGFAQLLELDPMTADQSESIERILAASRHMLFLLDDVLDVARIELRDLSLTLERLDLDEVVAEACLLVAPIAVAHDVVVTIADRSQLAVLADRGRLLEVLINLVANGIKYNRPGGSVRIACAAHAGAIRIEVRDTGRGIAESDMERMFLPFERLAPDNVQGTGLGLALAARLVEAMGGSIGVESRVGVGSVFSVDLPAAV